MAELIVWHRPPVLIEIAEMHPLDAALLNHLGAPGEAAHWIERDFAEVPWSFVVESLGTVVLAADGASPNDPSVVRAIELPDRTAAGLLWIRRIVEADGGVLVEDRWSRAKNCYMRLIDPNQPDAKRLASYLFDGGRWGPGAPKGRKASLNDILAAVLKLRRALGRDPTQEEVLGAIGYEEVRSLQRALEGSTWREVLGFASQMEEAERAHPDATIIHGFVSVAGAKTARLRPDSVLRRR